MSRVCVVYAIYDYIRILGICFNIYILFIGHVKALKFGCCCMGGHVCFPYFFFYIPHFFLGYFLAIPWKRDLFNCTCVCVCVCVCVCACVCVGIARGGG